MRRRLGESVVRIVNPATGEVDVEGVSYGARPVLHSFDLGTLVLKVPAHRRWSGLGQTANEPTTLIAYRVTARLDPERFAVEKIAETPVRSVSAHAVLAGLERSWPTGDAQ